ncbi:hypothetical protein SOASR029_02340 [Budvicia aquatica]|nr:hypothetical protein SOASR029_02340 [Budvicia aquatica]
MEYSFASPAKPEWHCVYTQWSMESGNLLENNVNRDPIGAILPFGYFQKKEGICER